jgi:hypothetical protein
MVDHGEAVPLRIRYPDKIVLPYRGFKEIQGQVLRKIGYPPEGAPRKTACGIDIAGGSPGAGSPEKIVHFSKIFIGHQKVDVFPRFHPRQGFKPAQYGIPDVPVIQFPEKSLHPQAGMNMAAFALFPEHIPPDKIQ